MKNHMKIRFPNFLIMLSIIFCSCGAGHHLTNDVIFKDTGFTYNQFKNSEMIIGGISSELINLTSEERIKYGAILSNVFVEKLKGAHNIHIVNTLQFMTKIGKEKYFEIMGNFDMEKAIRWESVRFVRDTMPDAKYILFAYIENENIIDRSIDQYIENEEGKKELETEYEKTYLMTIEFQMYDILQEKLVLNNVIYNQAERNESRTTRTGCVESCLDNVFQTILFGEPAEIDREEVLAKISEKYAKDLVKI
ncbi:MAG: hypothetical protein P8184_10035 [Calditrichia bacterium]